MTNILPPLYIDITQPVSQWPDQENLKPESCDAIINVNMIHISPWETCEVVRRLHILILFVFDACRPLLNRFRSKWLIKETGWWGDQNLCRQRKVGGRGQGGGAGRQRERTVKVDREKRRCLCGRNGCRQTRQSKKGNEKHFKQYSLEFKKTWTGKKTDSVCVIVLSCWIACMIRVKVLIIIFISVEKAGKSNTCKPTQQG